MPSFNKVVLVGHLTRDPEDKSKGEMHLATCGIATNRNWRSKDGEEREEVCFVDFACFGRLADVLLNYCNKGKALMLEGRLRYETWDGQDGGKRSRHTIIVENLVMLGGGGGGDRQGSAQQPQGRQGQQGRQGPPAGQRQQQGRQGPPAGQRQQQGRQGPPADAQYRDGAWHGQGNDADAWPKDDEVPY